MTDVAAQLDEMRLAVGEVDAIAAVTLKWFDDENWSGADSVLVERTSFMLGAIARSAAFAASKIDGIHVAVADTRPVSAGQAWDYRDGTASAEPQPMMASDHRRHR